MVLGALNLLYVMVNVRALLVPPLEQPTLPELPLGVLTVTLAVPGAEIVSVVIVTCNCSLLTTVVLSVLPSITTTEDETNWLPFTVRRKPCCTWANAIVVAERDPITGAGRALPHKGLSALQPGKSSKASRSALGGRKRALIRFIPHRTPGGPSEKPLRRPFSMDGQRRTDVSPAIVHGSSVRSMLVTANTAPSGTYVADFLGQVEIPRTV